MTTQDTQSDYDDARVNSAEQSSLSHAPTQDSGAAPSNGETYPSLNALEAHPLTLQPSDDMIARPFTEYFEEFRRSETFPSAAQGESTNPSNQANEGVVIDASPSSVGTGQSEEGSPVLSPALPVERPVSPLLRPASRIRVPKHGNRHRQEPVAKPAQDPASADATSDQQENASVAQETQTDKSSPAQEQQETQRPPRRYRFDRPAPTAVQAPANAHVVPQIGKSAQVSSTRVEQGQNGNRETRDASRVVPNGTEGDLQPAQASQAAQAPVENELSRPNVQHHPRQQQGHRPERTQKAQDAVLPTGAGTPETTVITPAPEIGQGDSTTADIALEDLPPLEYADLQAATSRRRRRRRVNAPAPAITPAAPGSPTTAITPIPTTAAAPQLQNVPTAPQSHNAPVSPITPVVSVTPFSIQSGATLNQMNQGGEARGPFMGPEPSPARGSVMQSSLRPLRTGRNMNNGDAQRGIVPAVPGTPVRPGEGIISNGGVNYLANVLKDAIQTQTDRIAAELRRSSQTPTSVTVSMPPFPSTERVGVFVDVANLLYSARNMRINIDFGKLLDFLRGNRRLVRAQAYCPTSPQPGEDQMFLQAVKGLGYRITTKNYKTFASGARKADLDLDLCMDVVRLVDGKAVDSIVLVSGDSDFMPMLDYCSDHGVRVEIAAFDESMSATLRQSCDLFVNLAMLEEIRA
ncbi:MAG TPA: NYN domain-containing protein [Ktedonobacteraceae bacterium]|nr:NYN domain-containing protein [Ktedonobacteraceae bacterium]